MKIVLFVLILFVSSLFAQGKVEGYVFDDLSHEPIVGANIVLSDTTIGTTTNENGYFKIENLKEGKVKIIVSFLGYETKTKFVFVNYNSLLNLKFYLVKKSVEMQQVIVTATRTERKILEVAGRVELIDSKSIVQTQTNSIDDLLKNVSGVNISRTAGIISRPTVSLRGIVGSEQGRLLTLIDGMPINKSDGGSINWNRINPDNIERIEIFKGPGSSIFGNNAMAGVINIITKRSFLKGFNGILRSNYSDYNTFAQSFNLNGKLSDSTGFYFSLSSFNRKSDGFIETKEEYRDTTTVKSDLKEFGADLKIGYDFNENSFIELAGSFYDDKRGNGRQIKYPDGSYMKHKTYFYNLNFETEQFGFKINSNIFFQLEKYKRVLEKDKFKKGKEYYSLIFVNSDRTDIGANLNINYNLFGHSILFGVEAKQGEVEAADEYQTSPDVIKNKGVMSFISVFLQDEFNLNEKLKLLMGFRTDNVIFDNGKYSIENSTGATSAMLPFTGELPTSSWKSLTPKLALYYNFSDNLNSYFSVSQGFRTATLDDLTRSGFIKYGFKKANTELAPETITNFELGFNFDLNRKFYLLPSFYFMKGNDFHYYLDTGESLFNGKKKVIKKANITDVQIVGAELDVKYFVNANLSFDFNYAFSKSKILKYEKKPEIEGKELTYSPNHILNLNISYLNKIVNFSIKSHFQSKQHTADDNVEIDKRGHNTIINSYFTFDIKMWKRLFNHLNFSIGVQNVFDEKIVTTYDKIGVGRFITADVSLNF